MRRWVQRLRAPVLPLLVHAGALVPLALLLWDFVADRLTANPIQDVQLRTGRYALVLLVLSLACTPASQAFRIPRIRPLRRTLGLYAFMYAALHTLNFVAIDYGFDFRLIRQDLFEKSYVLLGLAAFLALLLLAGTSTRGWMRRLGRSWRHVHWLVYPAAALAVGHFALAIKGDISRPVLFSVVLVLLLIARLPVVRRAARGLGDQLRRLLP